MTDRGDAIGVLELILPRYPDAQVVADVAAAAHALSYVVVANRRHTDLFEWGQRTTPIPGRGDPAATVARLDSPEAGQFTISGWSEPASAVVR